MRWMIALFFVVVGCGLVACSTAADGSSTAQAADLDASAEAATGEIAAADAAGAEEESGCPHGSAHGGHAGHAGKALASEPGAGHECSGGDGAWDVLYSGSVTRAAEELEQGVRLTYTAGCPHLQGQIRTAAAAKAAAVTGDDHGEDDGECPFHAEGVTVAVEELDNGAALVYSAEDPEIVQQLQQHAGHTPAKSEGCGCDEGADGEPPQPA